MPHAWMVIIIWIIIIRSYSAVLFNNIFYDTDDLDHSPFNFVLTSMIFTTRAKNKFNKTYKKIIVTKQQQQQ